MAEQAKFRTRMSRPDMPLPTQAVPDVGDVSPKGTIPLPTSFRGAGQAVGEGVDAVGRFVNRGVSQIAAAGVVPVRAAGSFLAGAAEGLGFRPSVAEAATPSPAPVATPAPMTDTEAIKNAEYWNGEIAAGRVGGNAGFRDQRVISYDDGAGRTGSYLNPANPENIEAARMRSVEVTQGDRPPQNYGFRAEGAAPAQPASAGFTEYEVGNQIMRGTDKAYYDPRGFWRNAQLGEYGPAFNSLAEAEAGNPIEVGYKDAGMRQLAAKAGLDQVTADLLPQKTASEAGLRQAQGRYYDANAEVAQAQADAGGFRPSASSSDGITTKVVEVPSSDPKQAALGTKEPRIMQTDAAGNVRVMPIPDEFAQAQAAVAAGADRSVVRQRLQQFYARDPKMLDIVSQYFPE